MVEKSLVLKQLSGILCLLNSYSKFTLPVIFPSLTVSFESAIVRFIKDWKKDKLY